MTDFVEKVARALCSLGFDDPDEMISDCHAVWETYYEAAKVAIKAMREPTEEMLTNVGPMLNYNCDYTMNTADSDHIEWWRDMIDEALKEADSEILFDIKGS